MGKITEHSLRVYFHWGRDFFLIYQKISTPGVLAFACRQDGYVNMGENPVGSQTIITTENHTADSVRFGESESSGFGDQQMEKPSI